MTIERGFEPGKKFRVTEAFPAGFFDGLSVPPLVVNPGDALTVTEEQGSGTWPAFVLVVNGSNQCGWVPGRCLKRRGREAVALKRYDTTTLNPSRNEVLTVIEADVESGWLWCRDKTGRKGWFAINRLSPKI
ncbi:MAG: SH3 domain-containing protein [Thermoplasmata archaeon]